MTDTVDRRVVEIDVRTARNFQATLTQAAGSLKGLESSIGSLRGLISDFAAGLAGAFTVHAFVEGIKSTIESIDAMNERAQKLGVTTEALSALTYQASLAGVEAQDLDVGIVKLNKALDGLGTETNDATKALARLGVEAGTGTEEGLKQIADAFQAMPDGVQKTALATEIFGKSGAKLIPMLNQGAEGMKEFREEAERLGIVIDSETAAAGDRLADNLQRIKAQGQGAMIQLTTGLMPALNDVAQAFIGTADKRKDMQELGSVIGTVVKAAATAFISLSTAVRIAGNVLGSWVAGWVALSRGDLMGAWTILKSSREEIQKIRDEASTKLGDLWQGTGSAEVRAQGTAAALDKVTGAVKKQKDELSEASKAWVKLIDDQIAAEKATAEASVPVDRLVHSLERVAELTGEAAAKKMADDIEQLDVAFFNGFITLEKYERGMANVTKTMTRGDAEAKRLADDLARLNELTGRTAAAQLAADVKLLDEAFFEGRLSPQEYDAALGRVFKTTDTLAKGTEKTTDAFLDMGKAIQQSIEGWTSQAADAILNFATGAQQNVGDMVNGILRQLAKMALQKAALDPLFKFAGEAIGGWFGSSTALPGARGLAFDTGGVRAFAAGGVVSSPTTFAFAGGTGLMGEAGPEAILPLQRNAAGQLGVSGAGGDVTVNVINQAGAEVAVETTRGANGEREISILIQRAVADGFARGRFDQVMGATYGVSRRGH